MTTKYFQFNWGLLWGFLGLTVIQCSEKESSINLPPRAVFTVYPKEGTLDTIFNLDASNSSDPEDDPALLTVRWDWENDQNWDTDYSSLKTDTHQFSSSGDKIIRMEVRDSSGLTATDLQVVKVWSELENQPPHATFTVSPQSGYVTTIFYVDACASYDPEDEQSKLEVRWDWENDGFWDTDFSTNKIESHQYASLGEKTIRLEIKDLQDSTATSTNLVSVISPTTVWLNVTAALGFEWPTLDDNHSCGITQNGRTYCWGNNTNGQLGYGQIDNSPVPILVTGDLGLVKVVAGMAHNCGLDPAGKAYCWGANAVGQLGNNSSQKSNVPVPVFGDLAFVELSAGQVMSCGISTEGPAYCWGANDLGQLGDETNASSLTPVRVASDFQFVSISSGFMHTCALTPEGDAYCWGQNNQGQLGIGDENIEFSNVPLKISGNLDLVALDAGGWHTCGIDSSEQAICWGQNTTGAIGDGTSTNRYSPVWVEGDLLFAFISAGSGFSCGISKEHISFCWGYNSVGQLGTDSLEDISLLPEPIWGEHKFETISAGNQHACAINSIGEAFCWGNNHAGELGDGSFGRSNRPVRVSDPL